MLALGGALLLVQRFANPDYFVQFFVRIPFGVGLERLGLSAVVPGYQLSQLLQWGLLLAIGLFIAGSIPILIASKWDLTNVAPNSKPTLLVNVFLCMALACLSHFFSSTMNNNPTQAYALIGIILGIAGGLYGEFLSKEREAEGLRPQARRKLLQRRLVGVCLVVIPTLIYGGQRAYFRREQASVSGARLYEYVDFPGLSSLRWAAPTYTVIVRKDLGLPRDKKELPLSEFMTLLNYLNDTQENFWAFPDYTLLHGLFGRPTPQPLLWFHKGLTYPQEYSPLLDKLVLDALVKNSVTLIVMEKHSFLRPDRILADFPVVRAYLAANFAPTHDFGSFVILAKKS